MARVRRAVIDVGTNSVKLLVADVRNDQVEPVLEQSHQTRLGRGFYQSHRLQPEAIAATAKAAAGFAVAARESGADSIRVIATSAARDACNAEELVSAITKAAGLSVDILSGEEEADLVFKGVTTAPDFFEASLLLLDVGGGSTEFILGRGRQKYFSQSFPLGSVRLMEQSPHSDPPTSTELRKCRGLLVGFLNREVEPKLGPALREERQCAKNGNVQLAGAGGT